MEEAAVLEDEDELLVQAALDSSPKGFLIVGAGSSVRTSSWPSRGAGSSGTLGRTPTSASTGLQPDSAQARVSVGTPASAKSAPASAPAQTDVLASANALPSSQGLGSAPGPTAGASPSLTRAVAPIGGGVVKPGGTVGSGGESACCIDV